MQHDPQAADESTGVDAGAGSPKPSKESVTERHPHSFVRETSGKSEMFAADGEASGAPDPGPTPARAGSHGSNGEDRSEERTAPLEEWLTTRRVCKNFLQRGHKRAPEPVPERESGRSKTTPMAISTSALLAAAALGRATADPKAAAPGEKQATSDLVAEISGQLPKRAPGSPTATDAGSGQSPPTSPRGKMSVKDMVRSTSTARAQTNAKMTSQRTFNKGKSAAELGGQLTMEDRLRLLVENVKFTVVIVIAVLLHTAFLAFDTDYELDRYPEGGSRSVAFAVDASFTSVYVAEACLRAGAERSQYLASGWNILDVCLIILSLVDLISVASSSASDPTLSVAPGLRMIRLLRLARLMRLLRFFKQLWLLACGVVSSMRTVIWAWFLVGILIYIFALFFMRTFSIHTCRTDSDPELDDLNEYFGSFPKSLLSTFQVTTLEDWALVAEVGAKHEPWIGPVFVLLLMCSTWGVMQAIIAVFVNSALEASMVRSKDIAKRQREEHEKACRQLGEVFRLADSDGNGVLSKAEFQSVMRLPTIIQRLNAVGIDANSAEALFDILDIDGSQSLDGVEFVEGVLRSRGNAQNKDLLGLRCDVWRVSLGIEEDLEMAVRYIGARVKQTMDRIEAVRAEAEPLLRVAAHAVERAGLRGKTSRSRAAKRAKTQEARRSKIEALVAQQSFGSNLAPLDCQGAATERAQSKEAPRSKSKEVAPAVVMPGVPDDCAVEDVSEVPSPRSPPVPRPAFATAGELDPTADVPPTARSDAWPLSRDAPVPGGARPVLRSASRPGTQPEADLVPVLPAGSSGGGLLNAGDDLVEEDL